MIKQINWFGKLTIILAALIIFSMAACDLDKDDDNDSSGDKISNANDRGILIINGLNRDVPGVVVFVDGVPTTKMNFLGMVSMENAIAGSIDTSSPFNILNRNGNTFTQSGNFLVVVPVLAGASGVNHYMSGVVLRNGSATINFSEMLRHIDLP